MTATSLAGKTVLITGASGGIGLEAAAAFAAMGANTVITGRSRPRIDAALGAIRARTQSNAVTALCADFASQAQVRALAADFLAAHDHLDILVNNAGSVNPKRTLTADGIETTFAVNHLAPYLLTRLLLPTVVASAPARIVNVASEVHAMGTLDFDDLGFERGYRIMRAYARSKLANVLFTRELARRLAGSGVTVNAVHPGRIATGIWNHGAPAWASGIANALLVPLKRMLLRPAEEGARIIVDAAIRADLAGRTGLYLAKGRIEAPGGLGQDDALAARLWAESARLTDLAET